METKQNPGISCRIFYVPEEVLFLCLKFPDHAKKPAPDWVLQDQLSVSEELIEGMDEWNTRHHFGSGLIDRVRNDSVSLKEAERQTLDFIKQHVPKNTAPLCGNSVWNDRQFLVKEMPSVTDYLHYRMVDVSTIKELARRWYSGLPKFEKKAAHLALDDIRESVFELVHFREHVFIDRQ